MNRGDIVVIDDFMAVVDALSAELSHDDREHIVSNLEGVRFQVISDERDGKVEIVPVEDDDVVAFGSDFTTLVIPVAALKPAHSEEQEPAPAQESSKPTAPKETDEPQIQKRIVELTNKIKEMGRPHDPEESAQIAEMRQELEELLRSAAQMLRLKVLAKVAQHIFGITAQVDIGAGLDWEYGSEQPNSFIKFTVWPRGGPKDPHSELHLDFKGGSKQKEAIDYSAGSEPAGTVVQKFTTHEDWSFSPNADQSLVTDGPGSSDKMTPEDAQAMFDQLNNDPAFKEALSETVSRWG